MCPTLCAACHRHQQWEQQCLHCLHGRCWPPAAVCQQPLPRLPTAAEPPIHVICGLQACGLQATATVDLRKTWYKCSKKFKMRSKRRLRLYETSTRPVQRDKPEGTLGLWVSRCSPVGRGRRISRPRGAKGGTNYHETFSLPFITSATEVLAIS